MRVIANTQTHTHTLSRKQIEAEALFQADLQRLMKFHRMHIACCWLKKFPHAYAPNHFQWFVDYFVFSQHSYRIWNVSKILHLHVRTWDWCRCTCRRAFVPIIIIEQQTLRLLLAQTLLIFAIIIQDAGKKKYEENICSVAQRPSHVPSTSNPNPTVNQFSAN